MSKQDEREYWIVRKFLRDGEGRWFVRGSARFEPHEEPEARAHFAEFVENQRAVLSNGLRIELRRGKTILAIAGGVLDLARAKEIRWL